MKCKVHKIKLVVRDREIDKKKIKISLVDSLSENENFKRVELLGMPGTIFCKQS